MAKHKKLPPEPQPSDGSREGKALKHIMDIKKTSGQIRTDLNPYGAYVSKGQGVILIKRRGKIVWRTAEKAGADFDRPPIAVDMIRTEREMESALNKIRRNTRIRGFTKLNNEIRSEQSAQLKIQVLELAETHFTASIAKKLNISQRRVQQIIKDNKK